MEKNQRKAENERNKRSLEAGSEKEIATVTSSGEGDGPGMDLIMKNDDF